MNFPKDPRTNWEYILIIVTLAIIVGGGILWFSTRQEVPIKFPEIKKPEKIIEDETANWKTYRNEEYGYELKYYKDWTYKEAGPYTYFFPEVYEDIQFTAIQAQVFIWNENLNQPKEGRTLNMEEHLCAEKCPPEIIYSVKENSKIVILKLNIQKEVCGHTGCIEQRSVYSLSDSETEDIVHQILSTFRFIETGDETANWKTYRNEKYGYEIKLPKDWGEFSAYDGSFISEEISQACCLLLGSKTMGRHIMEIYVREDFSLGRWLDYAEKQPSDVIVVRINDGVEAKKVVLEGETIYGEKWKNTHFLIEKNNNLYEFVQLQDEIEKIEDLGIIDQILSTFRFLE